MRKWTGKLLLPILVTSAVSAALSAFGVADHSIAEFSQLVQFCRKNIAPERLHGFLMTTWEGTLPSCEAKLARGIDLAADALSCPRV